MEEVESESYLVPLVDEEEKVAKLLNSEQNGDKFKDLIPVDISNELGFDYVKEELTVKKRPVVLNELFEMLRSLNRKQKEFFYEVVSREQKDLPYHLMT